MSFVDPLGLFGAFLIEIINDSDAFGDAVLGKNDTGTRSQYKLRSLSVLSPTHASPSCEQPTQQVDGAVHDHVEGFGRELGVAGRPRLVAATLQRSPRGDVPRIAVRHVRHESPRRG